MRAHLAASTQARDRSYLRSLILPKFGATNVGNITTADIETWVRGLGRAPETVHKAFQILSGVLSRAVRTRRISVNPALLAEGLPRIERTEMRFLTVDEVKRLAAACDGYETLVWAAALTGLRWAELVGLRWSNVNLETRTITVAETVVEVDGRLITKGPKTPASRRQVVAPVSLIDMLEPGHGSVFGRLHGSNFRKRVWEPATREVGLEGVRFHDLRHTQAAWLIERGVHPKVIQHRLGHSSIKVTLDRYGHLMEGLDAAAADGLDGML